MIETRVWIELIMQQGISLFAKPSKEFINYQSSKMYEYYRSYLEFAMVALYDDSNFEDFMTEGYAQKFNLPEKTINKLAELYRILDAFYDDCRELGDFEVIRRKEWDVVIPLAKSCLDGLSAINTDSDQN